MSRVVIIQYIAFSNQFLSLCNMHLNFLHVFSSLDSSFLFSTEKYSVVWMSNSLCIFYLLKDILLVSKFGHLWIILLLTSMCRFSCGHNFQFIWVNSNEYSCWIMYVHVRVCSFRKKQPDCLAKWLYCFSFPLAIYESSYCSTSSPACGITSTLHLLF